MIVTTRTWVRVNTHHARVQHHKFRQICRPEHKNRLQGLLRPLIGIKGVMRQVKEQLRAVAFQRLQNRLPRRWPISIRTAPVRWLTQTSIQRPSCRLTRLVRLKMACSWMQSIAQRTKAMKESTLTRTRALIIPTSSSNSRSSPSRRTHRNKDLLAILLEVPSPSSSSNCVNLN